MQTYYYKEPRLQFNAVSEFSIRLITTCWYIFFSVVTIILLFSDISKLFWLGVFFGLFLVDRVFHIGEAERALNELKGEKINCAAAVTPAAYRIVDYTMRKHRMIRQNFYIIFLKALLDREDIKEALRRLGVSPSDLAKKIDETLQQSAITKMNASDGSKLIKDLMVTAYYVARDTNERFIEPRNLFVALTTVQNPDLVKLFEFFELSAVDLRESIIFGRWRKRLAGLRRMPAVLGGFAHRPYFLRHRVMNRAWTARPTPMLDQFSTDLTDMARAEQIGLLIGHTKEFDQLLSIISRPGKPNALLVGDAGIGKSTMIAHLAFRMVKDQVPSILFDKRLVSLEIGDLVADAPPEVLAGRIQKVVQEIILAGNIVLFIPNIHDLFRTSQTKALSALDLLLPIVKSEAIPVIGETYSREFKQYIEPRSDFLEQFEVIKVEEISEEECLRFLTYSSLILEREFNVFITFSAVRTAVKIAKRYFRNKVLPGSALDLLKQALAKAHQLGHKALDEEMVIDVAETQSKIPIQKAGAAEAEKLLQLEKIIHDRLVNQEAAVKAVSRALREYRSGLSRRGGPIAAFLFVGPTGVGKTELAKILAQTQFGSKEFMHRFDMTEYQNKDSISRFLGTPSGEQTGTLTDAVFHAPYSLVLLDEFEKAHPDILNLFLQVFDDGRLTDTLGRTVSFENTIIIATSNAHSNFIKEEIEKGKTSEEVAEELKKKLTDYFKPELINRFSDVMVFRNLTVKEINKITIMLIKEVVDILQESQGIELKVDDNAIQKITELGYSPVFGARPLRQVISEKVKSALAEKILRREVSRGNTLQLSFNGNQFELNILNHV